MTCSDQSFPSALVCNNGSPKDPHGNSVDLRTRCPPVRSSTCTFLAHGGQHAELIGLPYLILLPLPDDWPSFCGLPFLFASPMPIGALCSRFGGILGFPPLEGLGYNLACYSFNLSEPPAEDTHPTNSLSWTSSVHCSVCAPILEQTRPSSSPSYSVTPLKKPNPRTSGHQHGVTIARNPPIGSGHWRSHMGDGC